MRRASPRIANVATGLLGSPTRTPARWPPPSPTFSSVQPPLLLVVSPVMHRYDLDRDMTIWLIPIGGMWGIAPDVHHIVPVFSERLYGSSIVVGESSSHITIRLIGRLLAGHLEYLRIGHAVHRRSYGVPVFVRARSSDLVACRPFEHTFVVYAAAATAGTPRLWYSVSA